MDQRNVHTIVHTTHKTSAPLQWHAYEYEHSHKSIDWYWTVGIIAVAGAIAALLFQNYLLAFLILLGAFVVLLLASHEPHLATFELNHRGIRVDDTLYPYKTLDSFYVHDDHDDEQPKLLVKSRKFFMPLIIIPIEDYDPTEVRAFLLQFLDEEEHHEPLIHHLAKIFGL